MPRRYIFSPGDLPKEFMPKPLRLPFRIAKRVYRYRDLRNLITVDDFLPVRIEDWKLDIQGAADEYDCPLVTTPPIDGYVLFQVPMAPFVVPDYIKCDPFAVPYDNNFEYGFAESWPDWANGFAIGPATNFGLRIFTDKVWVWPDAAKHHVRYVPPRYVPWTVPERSPYRPGRIRIVGSPVPKLEPAPFPEPAPTLWVGNTRAPAPKPAHRRQPPPVGRRERKDRVPLATWQKLVKVVVNGVTETLDLVDAVHDALPPQLRAQRPLDKLDAIWRHYDRIDIPMAISNIALNQVQDAMFGLTGNAIKQATKQNPYWWSPRGPQAGPLL